MAPVVTAAERRGVPLASGVETRPAAAVDAAVEPLGVSPLRSGVASGVEARPAVGADAEVERGGASCRSSGVGFGAIFRAGFGRRSGRGGGVGSDADMGL